jgi:ABC-2 type transport system permease protein
MITTLNTSIGLLIGSLSENENVAILFSLMLSLPFLFLSGTFFPLELMPGYIQLTSRIIPLRNEVRLLKQTMVLGWDLETINPLLTELGLISLILLLITYLIIRYKD